MLTEHRNLANYIVAEPLGRPLFLSPHLAEHLQRRIAAEQIELLSNPKIAIMVWVPGLGTKYQQLTAKPKERSGRS